MMRCSCWNLCWNFQLDSLSESLAFHWSIGASIFQLSYFHVLHAQGHFDPLFSLFRTLCLVDQKWNWSPSPHSLVDQKGPRVSSLESSFVEFFNWTLFNYFPNFFLRWMFRNWVQRDHSRRTTFFAIFIFCFNQLEDTLNSKFCFFLRLLPLDRAWVRGALVLKILPNTNKPVVLESVQSWRWCN